MAQEAPAVTMLVKTTAVQSNYIYVYILKKKQIHNFITAPTIQKQLETCDLTKTFTKLGNSGSRFD